MRILICIGLIVTLMGCSAVPEGSKRNDFTYQTNTKADSWRYVWLPVAYADQASLREKFSSYSNFYIAPTQLEGQGADLTEQKLREFANYLESEAQATLADYKTPVSSPQANSLTVQFALSNVVKPNPIRAATSSVMPIGLAISYASMLTKGEHTNVATARIEVLISDSQTKEPLFSAIDIVAGEKSLDNILEPEAEIKNILQVWVNKLEKTLIQIP